MRQSPAGPWWRQFTRRDLQPAAYGPDPRSLDEPTDAGAFPTGPRRDRAASAASTAPRLDPAASAAPAAPRLDRPAVAALVALLRPRQWIKNGLVIAAAGAAGALGHDDVPGRVGVACLAFCLLASGIYAVNDVRDAPEDRLHPRKRFRPVASGEINPGAALALGLGLMVAGLLLCWWIRPLLAVVGGGYLALTLTYTMAWRYVPVLDVVAIGGGFVLRAVAGGVAAPVTLSRWFILVISATAVFVAAAKRDSELRRTALAGTARRRVLEHYPPELLNIMMVGSVAVAIFAYSMWAFIVPAADGFPWRPTTIIPFAVCLLRYWSRVRAGAAEAPEDVLLSDRPLQIAGAAWLILFALSVNAGS